MTTWTVELNADLAEGAPHDAEILSLVQRANVCLGAHAGSIELTDQTVKACVAAGVAVCAHPGYPDRDYFGRRGWSTLSSDPTESILRQLEDWVGTFESVKPHGGFYNDSQSESPAFDLLVEVLRQAKVALVGMPGTQHERAATEAGVAFISEGFADRAYTPTGRLVPRSQPGAYVRMDGLGVQLESLRGKVRSLCVHGDGDQPVERLRAVRDWLTREGAEVKAWTP